MRCGQLMKAGNLECSYPWETATVAAARMRFRDVGFLPVLNREGQVIGTVTDRDLTTRVLADGLSGDDTSVGSIMSRGVVYCHPWEDLAIVEDRMVTYRKSRIVCVDEHGRPVGVISLSDVARGEEASRAGSMLRGVAAREARPH